MKHEKFKLFIADTDNITTDTKVLDFLNSGITPKSISLSHGAATTTLCVGYTDDPTTDKYRLIRREILMPTPVGATYIQEELNKLALDVDGVICQDVLLEPTEVIITFLTIH